MTAWVFTFFLVIRALIKFRFSCIEQFFSTSVGHNILLVAIIIDIYHLNIKCIVTYVLEFNENK